MLLRKCAQTPQNQRRRRNMFHLHSKTMATPEGLLSKTGIHHHAHNHLKRTHPQQSDCVQLQTPLSKHYCNSILLSSYKCMFYHCYIVANLSSVIEHCACFVYLILTVLTFLCYVPHVVLCQFTCSLFYLTVMFLSWITIVSVLWRRSVSCVSVRSPVMAGGLALL